MDRACSWGSVSRLRGPGYLIDRRDAARASLPSRRQGANPLACDDEHETEWLRASRETHEESRRGAQWSVLVLGPFPQPQ
ncbi:hypothetical protein EYF80_021675 [Liparis tanakae]|uniref:Uncharacterized protein n=1 Tax=Liparis tanakae TaxID=230148 RepID=A0A4Z2HQW3_9TELE|nr:hypothetical protein EYF80_021675 [Liparis tanakae]